jgi:hypothetical protein
MGRKKLCGARRKRDGQPCVGGVEPGRTRCKYHGGMSTGPRTVEGRARVSEAQKMRWRCARKIKLHLTGADGTEVAPNP